jgi:hypothetical protein
MVDKTMRNLDDIIRCEGESTYVDFKKIPYLPYIEKKKMDLIKDIMSLANADVDGDRYVIIGVKFDDKKQRILVGVSPSDIPDPAEYQQFIQENIEPEIKFDVFCYPLEDKIFGIIKISSCDNGPYGMRKPFGTLKKGEMWIRKGTTQSPMIRADLDRIYEERHSRSRFDGEIKITFDETDSTEVVFPALGEYFRPSDYYKRDIEQALDRKRNPPLSITPTPMADIMRALAESDYFYALSNPFDYDHYSIVDLEKKLVTVREDFREDDLYDLYEENGQHLVLTIANISDQYLEDVLLRLELPRHGVCVATQVYPEPNHGILLSGPVVKMNPSGLMSYPIVENTESSIIITETIGDIRHHLPKFVFNIPPRAVFSKDLVDTTIEAKCTIHARNLETPYVQPLIIRIVEPVPQGVDLVNNLNSD